MSKIALVTNIPAPYRVDLFYYMQTNIMEHEFHVIYTRENEDNREWKIKKDKMLNSYILNSKVIKIKGKVDTRYIHVISSVGKELNKINPDVVIAFEYNLAALQTLWWCKYHHKKFIHLTDGTLFSERNIGKVQRLTRRIITKNCNACIASSSKSVEKLMKWGVSRNKIFLSLLTVDISEYLNDFELYKNVQNNDKIILFVGGITKRKGIDLLFDALPYIKNDYSVRIVGNGTEDDIKKFKTQAKDLGVLQNVIWCGFKSGKNLVNEYKNATLFVLPAREDCFGLVLVEAMCSLKPIITSKYADGAYDIIKDSVNGYIVDPYNSREFGRKMDALLNSKELQNNFIQASIERRKKFAFSEVVKGYLKAIQYVSEK